MIYFASDFHLGFPTYDKSRERENKIISWLDTISVDATEIHLVGDVFDFWHEWKRVVPKYFVRFMAKTAELVSRGIDVYFYVGNHDLWTYGYLEKELGWKVIRKPQVRVIGNKSFFIAHGDETPYESRTFKVMKSVFKNRFAQWFYANVLHPDLSAALAIRFSSRRDRCEEKEPFLEENDYQIKYARDILKTGQVDFFVFGHRHVPYVYELTPESKVIGLGDWLTEFTYARYDGENVELLRWK